MKGAFRTSFMPLAGLLVLAVLIGSTAYAQPLPGGTLDPTTIPKYVTPLVIPPVMQQSTASPAPAAQYDIAVRQFKQQILPGGIWDFLGGTAYNFPATTVWSYGRAEDPAPDLTVTFPTTPPGLPPGVAPAPNSSFNYPAFTIEATTNMPTTVRWINDLKDPITGNFLPHLLSIDQSLQWANPPKANCITGDPNRTDCETGLSTPYTGPVPIVTHVHGAHVQGVSDGYPEAWWLPAANDIPAGYATRGSRYDQANRTNTVPGSAYFSYENTQAAATIWYHDHALGMTRNNVYAGPAGFWLIRGGAYDTAPGVLPGPAPSGTGDPNFDGAYRQTIREIPIAIQDRSFNADGSLFYPSVRSFFDGFTGPYIGGGGTPGGLSDIAGIWNPEAFFNTMVVNGTTWPKFDVAPARYRFRFLNGCDSRTLNFSMFTVTGPGTDNIMGTADDALGTEVPFYQIGVDQGFLSNVVMITKGFSTILPGNGTIPTPTAAPSTEQGLLLGPAERADVIIDFGGMVNGTRVRILNTGPDSPFGGFPAGLLGYVPSDPGTSGQVMDFIVNTALPAQPTDTSSTPPASLLLPAPPAIGTSTVTRQVSLNEMVSDQVCVEVDPIVGTVVRTIFSTTPGDATFLATCAAAAVAPGNLAEPAGPRMALLGVLTTSTGNLTAVPKKWHSAITEAPSLNSTETWEIFNTTADAHPIHLHLVSFEIVDREDLDPVQLGLGNIVPTGVIHLPEPNELGPKDTVMAYPEQLTRLKATFDISGLYVWHCHILSHEDNEMMMPLIVYADSLYGSFPGSGLWEWKDGKAWSQLAAYVPTKAIASDGFVYGDYGAGGMWQWNGTAWSPMNAASPVAMAAAGQMFYGDYGPSGLWQWNGTAWSQLSNVSPSLMVANGSLLYAAFGPSGLWQWNGTAWSPVDNNSPIDMVVEDSALFANFGASGLWRWNGTTWSQIHTLSPVKMALLKNPHDSHLFVDLGATGLWEWVDAEGLWTQIDPASPISMLTSGIYLYADYGAGGLQQWDSTREIWTRINATAPLSMVASGTIIYGDFGDSGLWQWDGTAWSPVLWFSPASMTTGF